MGRSRRLHLIILAVVAITVAGMLGGCRSREAPAPQPSPQPSLGRLGTRLAARADYQVFVGVPTASPARWVKASSYTRTTLVTEAGEIDVADVEAFVIAYPSGQALDAELGDLDMPPGIDGVHEGPRDPTATLDPEAARAGLARLAIEFAPSPAQPDAVDHYATTLHNRSGEPVRITRFAAFVEDGGAYRINTVTGAYFSADEFQQWYGVPASGWIQPDARVTDPDNFGGPGVIWAFHAETASGATFVAGVLLADDWRTR